MLYIGLSVCCSVLVAILLKLAPRWHIDLIQALGWNYVLAALLCHTLSPAPPLSAAASLPWLPLLGLGLLLPVIFLVQSRAIHTAGIVKSEVAQRLSLLLSLLAAFVWFGEPMSLGKTMGMALGFAALGCLLSGREDPDRQSGTPWLGLVLVGFAVIDILFKQVARAGASFIGSLQASFVLAAILCALAVIWRGLHGRHRLAMRHLFAGLLLGGCNFGNILFYLRAHLALPDQPALVFTAMNLGVVSLGALVGAIGFKERLRQLHFSGLGLSLIAIATLAYSHS